jgi:MFS family permease
MNTPTHSVETSYGWVIIAASLAIHTIGLAAPTVLFVALKPIALEFDWPRAVPSLAYSLLMLGSGVGGIAMGMWMDRRGVRQPVLFGSCMIAAGAFLASQAEGQLGLYMANGVLIGLLGKAAMIAPLMANATRWFDRRRGIAVAILASAQGLSGLLWLPLIGYLNQTVGWRDTYLYFAVFGLLTMLPLTLLLKRPPDTLEPVAPAKPATGDSIAAKLRFDSAAAQQIIMWIAVLGCCTGMSIPIVHLISHATDLGFSAARGAQMLTLLFTAAFFSRIAFGAIADRIGPTRTLMFGSACQAAVLALFAMVDSLHGLYLAALLFGLGFAGIMPCYPLVIRLLFPVSEAGWRIAAQYMFAAAGMAFGGWVAGFIFDQTGAYKYAFLAGAGFTCLNLALVTLLHWQHKSHQALAAPA